MVLCPSKSLDFSSDDWMKAFGLHFVGFCWLLNGELGESGAISCAKPNKTTALELACVSTPFHIGIVLSLTKDNWVCHWNHVWSVTWFGLHAPDRSETFDC